MKRLIQTDRYGYPITTPAEKPNGGDDFGPGILHKGVFDSMVASGADPVALAKRRDALVRETREAFQGADFEQRRAAILAQRERDMLREYWWLPEWRARELIALKEAK